MSSLPVTRRLLAKPFGLVLGFALLVVVVKAVIFGMGMHDNFASMGNDDIMRLLSVRDWIAGQGWYDTTQYRLLPPDGVSLHWSRYIDLGIASIIVPLSYIVPMDTAEQLAVSIWPTLIMIISVLVVGFGTRRLFGAVPACFAVLCLVFWPVTASLHTSAGNIDHHNVQMLMMMLLGFAVVWPSRPVGAGLVGGLAAAFSLAVGLESLPFIVGAGMVVLIRALFLPTQISRQLLVVFCVTLGLGSLLFWAGQTAPSNWGNAVCDQLSLPTLGLVAVAAVACVLPMTFGRVLHGPWMHLAATVVLTGLGILLIWPVMAGCLDGPYGDLPIDLQETISSRITEAKPVWAYMQRDPDQGLMFLLPVLVALLLGGFQWLGARQTEGHGGQKNQALGLLLILCLVGTAMVFVQMRTVIMVASVVPIIGGLVIARLLDGYLKERDLTQGLVMIVVAVTIISPNAFIQPFVSLWDDEQSESITSVSNCRGYASIVALNDVPPAVVLTHLNFGPLLIWATHHQGLAAPYHRSATSLANGIAPFRLDSAQMADYVRDAGATHLLLCRGYRYDSDFARELASGGSADWLHPIALSDDAQLLFEVLP
jgi:hypothetical protein